MIRLSITHYWTTEMRREMNGYDVTKFVYTDEFGGKKFVIENDYGLPIFEWEEDSEGNEITFQFPF